MIRPAMLALLGLLGAIQPAIAENRSVSQSIWTVARDRVTLRFVLPAAEARQLSPKNLPPPSTEQVASYVLGHVSVSAAGSACPAIDQGYDIGRIDTLSVGDGLYGFEIIFQCPGTRDMLLHNAVLFERVPQHIDFARIEQNGAAAAQLFTFGSEQLRLPDNGAAIAAGTGEYLRLGVSHIRHGFDRICFLAGLLVLVGKRRDLLGVASGLLLGYGASSAVAAGGYAIPNMPAVESAVGFLVAFIAAQAIAWEVPRPRLVAAIVGGAMLLVGAGALVLRGAQVAWLPVGLGLFAASLVCISDHRLPVIVVPAAFGFLDGLVLPGEYARLPLWHQASIPGLLAFNAGALLADALLIGFFLALLAALRRSKFTVPGAIARDLAATAFSGLGAFWMLSRLYA
jgi:hypothetical protein